GRYGRDIVIIWDADDAISDIYAKAAYSVARALAIKENETTIHTAEAMQEIELATRAVEKQIKHLEDFATWGETVSGHGEKIVERAKRMKADLAWKSKG